MTRSRFFLLGTLLIPGLVSGSPMTQNKGTNTLVTQTANKIARLDTRSPGSAPAACYQNLTAPVTVWIDTDCRGQRIDSSQTSVFPDPMKHAVSSLAVTVHGWVAFFEDDKFSAGDDVLWVKGPCIMWSLPGNWRPHGTNNWNDVIRAVEIPNPPVSEPNTNTENRAVVNCGN